MPGPECPAALARREPLVSLYYARHFIADENTLELLDSVIVLVIKQMLKAEKIDALPREPIADPFVRECLESPVMETPANQTLPMAEVAAILGRLKIIEVKTHESQESPGG